MQIIECPRDAMQGIREFIPTDKKIKYINFLLKVGFHTLDMGSFVSPKAVPQMADTAAVIQGIDDPGKNKLLVIIANRRGAEEAVKFERVNLLGYPLSVSETFQQRNTNRSIANAIEDLLYIRDQCKDKGKELVVYLSMGFGNPYNDPYSPELLADFSNRLFEQGISIISLSDTVGVASPEAVEGAFSKLIKDLPGVTFGAHLHANPAEALKKLKAAWKGGCRRFDGAILGFGGCPMADDHLTGNMPTEKIIEMAEAMNQNHGLEKEAFGVAMAIAGEVFP